MKLANKSLTIRQPERLWRELRRMQREARARQPYKTLDVVATKECKVTVEITKGGG